ncbi:MAG TPA: adenylosuccinate lyase, partial [bacterium]|nr:adenylosuccinate lyase [bacterium]
MIPRYSRPEMAAVWSDENRYQQWLKVELAALEGWQKIGLLPEGTVKTIREQVRIDPARIAEIEKTTQHDVIAFVE